MTVDVLPRIPVVAYGDGLVSVVKDKMASFVVDSKQQRGELTVQVDGQHLNSPLDERMEG